jgi:hypothetical protein
VPNIILKMYLSSDGVQSDSWTYKQVETNSSPPLMAYSQAHVFRMGPQQAIWCYSIWKSIVLQASRFQGAHSFYYSYCDIAVSWIQRSCLLWSIASWNQPKVMALSHTTLTHWLGYFLTLGMMLINALDRKKFNNNINLDNSHYGLYFR